MINTDLKYGVLNFIKDSKNPLGNYLLGTIYEGLGQTASAASFYIRTAEFGDEELLKYEALLRTALCFNKQGSRVFVVKGILLRAISLIPDRPEAYFLLSRTYEVNKDWQEAYTWATLGEQLFNNDKTYKELHSDVEYPGLYGFVFEKAVAGWWIGLYEESLHLFKKLSKRTDMRTVFTEAVRNNLKNLWGTWKNPIRYDNSMYEKLRFKFNGAIDIERNYSQCFQDMFVLSILDGYQGGKFLEIGCGDPFFGNNTYLLERYFGWAGISIDINPDITEVFAANRKSRVITHDAVTLDYGSILEGDYEYLQIDCDPPIVSLNVLKKIPFEYHKFAVITFEHDFYNGDNSIVREDSRKYLSSFGYKMIVGNIAADKYYAFEDWYVHPDLVDKNIVEKMLSLNDSANKADDYIFNR
jgi:hypothetical protein